MSSNKLCFLIALVSFLGATAHADVIVQQPGDHFLAFEAEDYDTLEGDPEFGGWIEVFPDEALESNIGNPILPEDSNVSGSAMFDSEGGNNFVDVLNYQLQFAEAGVYSVYLRYTMFDMINDPNYGNEDSFYFPLELGDLAEQDGWFSLAKHGHNDSFEDPPFWEGQFHWMGPFTFNSGDPVEYEVTAGDVGQVLDFQISQRERGSTLDAVVFSTEFALFEEELDEILESLQGGGGATLPGDYNGDQLINEADVNAQAVAMADANPDLPTFDENGDGAVNFDDRLIWIHDHAKTWVGDSNLDNEFNSGDLVAVFTAGKFEVDEAASWAEGDWNGDMRFGSGDLVAAFTDGGYELGPPPAAAVPEPSAIGLCLLAICLLAGRRRLLRTG